MQKPVFSFSPSDIPGMQKLMDKFGSGQYPFSGKNENGEETTYRVYPDKIIVHTNQKNGWRRKNIYHRDGTVEEFFVEK